MPSVNIAPATYEALKRVAEKTGSDVAATLERAVTQFLSLEEMSEEEYQRQWDELLAEVRANIPPGITPEQVDADIDAATDEVWAERRAGGR